MDPLHFRKSHLKRIGHESLEQLDRTIQESIAKPTSEMPTLSFSGIEGGVDLRRSLESDYAQLLAEIIEEDRDQEQTWDTRFLQDLGINSSLKVDAFLEAENHHPRIRISRGLCLALDDALLTALCVLGVFTARLDQGDLPEGYPLGVSGPDQEGRYFDYSKINDSDVANLPGDLTSRIPLDPVRLAQQDLLFRFAVQWVCFHEQGHWVLGHMDWLQSARKWNISRLDEALFVDSGRGGRSEDLYCLELQADAFAIQLFFSSGLSEDFLSMRWVKSYREALAAYGHRRRCLAPDLSQREDRFYVLLLASSVSCLLFELRREKLRKGSPVGSTHPPPATRLLNIFVTAIQTWGDVAQFESGRDYDSENVYQLVHLRSAISIAMRVFVELEMMTRVIGLSSSLYRSSILFRKKNVTPTPADVSPLAEDFLRLIKGECLVSRFVTDGGRIYAGLLERFAALQLELKPFLRIPPFR